MNKILTIGDLHGTSSWKNLDFDKYDKVIFLGDYVDSFDLDDRRIYDNLTELIEVKKNHDKIILLWGNHDAHYLSNPAFYCKGHRPSMSVVLNLLFEENRNLFKLAHQESDYLFSHAGVSQEWYDNYFQDFAGEIEGLTLADRLNKAFDNNINCIFKVGHRRGGSGAGGPLWADMNELLESPLKNYRQIVGHTRSKEIIEAWPVVFLDVIEENPEKDIKELVYEIIL